MIFSALCLLFFALDIFALSKFRGFGNLYVNLLGSGIGIYLIFALINSRKKLKSIPRIFFLMLGLHVFLYCLFNFTITITVTNEWFRPYYNLLFELDGAFNHILLWLSGIFTVVLIFLKFPPEYRQHKYWALFSFFVCGIKYIITIVFSTIPRPLWRYLAVIDFLLFYSWLVLIIRCIHLRYNIAVFNRHLSQSA